MLEPIKKIIRIIVQKPTYYYIGLFFIFLLLLSLLRNANTDETTYLRETMVIAELLKRGEWIGNYGVGLHGFMFKVPVAILFLILDQPSVLIATLFTISISILSLLLFYKIIRKHFFNEMYSFGATVLFSLTLYFINTSISFNRDIPAVFATLLFLYLFLKDSSKWLIGLSLLLILDAKEHVFITVAPLYGIYIFLSQISLLKIQGIIITVKNTIVILFKGYFFSLLWIMVMFTTGIIPVNMFLASTTGLTQTGLAWTESHFSVEKASQNTIEEEPKEIFSLTDLTTNLCDPEGNYKNNGECEVGDLVCESVEIIDVFVAYIGKALYPRTFSFISIPKIIVLPALVMAISMFVKWLKERDSKYILPLILWFNVIVIILRVSHGRYLLAVSPLFMVFFLLFIRDGLRREIFFRNTLIATTLFVILGLFFESSFILFKIIIEITLLTLLWSIWIFKNKGNKLARISKQFFLLMLSIAMFFTSLAFLYSIGQISSYINYGYNRETQSIASYFDNNKKIWINSYGSSNLIHMYRKNLYIEPEWKWSLNDKLPKKSLLKTYKDSTTFMYDLVDLDSFQKRIREDEIEYIVLIVSTLQGDSFAEQEHLSDLMGADWLRLEDEVPLKNKVMYVFNVER